MEIVTACTLDCSDTCSLLITLRGDGSIRIKGNPKHPFTAGFTCGKIRRLPYRLESAHRITTPLLRKGQDWQSIGWQEALQLCAQKIQEYRSESETILHIRGDGDKGVLSQASKLFFASLGASQVEGSLCDMAGIAACIADFGSLDTNDLLDLANASAVVNWGKDLGRSSNHVAAIVGKVRKSGGKVLTVSPGGDGNRMFSDKMIRIRPGTDRFLAAAVIHLLIQRSKIDDDVLERTQDWPQFRELITSRSVSELAGASDVSKNEVEELFEYYSLKEPVASLLGWGLQRYKHGGENVRFINALALLAGNIGRCGGGSYFNISSTRNFNLSWAKGSTERKRRTLLLPRVGKDILETEKPPI
ncbi:MAG: molybdopterin-dependent oxidoreductase, partial [Deltaproteobacteria bacterium]|nr:molybdopterin-dependent oxidoreductase [Deltaproteobacteria bacterium]